MNYHRQHKPNSEALKDRSEREVSPFTPSEAPLMRLQSTIGNRALQRLFIKESGTPAIQRDGWEDAKPTDNQKSRFMALLTVSIDGKKLKGSSKISGHEEAIELLNFSHGQGMANNFQRDEETPRYQGLELTKNIDGTSAAILEATAKGLPITFKLVVGELQADGKFTAVTTVESDDALFTSYNAPGAGESDTPAEIVVISYRPPKKKK